jgi:protein TonB
LIRRLAIALLAGAVATFALFFLMQSLIARGSPDEEKQIAGSVIDFVRLKDDSETQTKRRRVSRPQAKAKPPPPPDMRMAKVQKPRGADLTTTAVSIDFYLAGGPLGGISGDSDVVPLVRIEPQYPTRANSRGIEGWVLIEFTITPVGTVRDPVVVDSEPSRVFDSAAKRAVLRWKYRPKIEDGKPVERPGVQVVLTFQLED